MYVPAHFKEDRVAVLHDAIKTYGFGTLVTSSEQELEASHLPLLLDPEPAPLGTVLGHLARANPQWTRVKPDVQALADKNFELLRNDPRHPSLRLKQIGELWSARVGRNYRALARPRPEGLVWFWIGPHDEYDQIIAGQRG